MRAAAGQVGKNGFTGRLPTRRQIAHLARLGRRTGAHPRQHRLLNKLLAASSKAATDEVLRVCLAQGVAHCGRGPGPDTFDVQTPLEKWVEQGIAPEKIIASKVAADGSVTRTRPLCVYPQVAKYAGSRR